MLPTIVRAHTHLSTSNPAEGQVVTEELKQIVLTFDGNIEKLSTMNLLKDGTEVPAFQVQIDAGQMTGTLSEPLGNGAYLVQWSIAGEDGHPISGAINFSVQREETLEGEDTSETEQNPNTPTSNLDDQSATSGDDESTEEVKEITTDTTIENVDQNAASTTVTLGIGLVLIVGIGSLLLIRRKH
jgi:copper resistance protein C